MNTTTTSTTATPSDTQIEVTRTFHAPVEKVWESFTDADLVRDWMMGPPGWTMPVCEMDFRIGGAYENVFRDEDSGAQISIVGDFREIEPFRKIVQDEKHVIGDAADEHRHETVVTFYFEADEGRTTVTTLIEYATREARDEALATGMAAAMEQGYQRIDAQVAR